MYHFSTCHQTAVSTHACYINKQRCALQELLQHSMLQHEQLNADSQLVPQSMETLCEPLLRRVIPEALQSTTRTTEEGSAAMVVSETMRVCALHAGASSASIARVLRRSHPSLPDPRDCCVQRALQRSGCYRQLERLW